ncbi:putative quinol monooxygenase [Paraglaciecola sp. L3A3]|uniref:putative quinol monooxygenase n=1 Tax=Paraglaciecola sp. L3A3 TaxID=2686358 RepID=UPI00131C16DC|nr:putative quinol monooxygenase [Paraglaciecola sp. L3A3]
MYVVTVKFDVEPSQLTEFTELMLKQAEDSLTLEENCLQFDVCHAEDKASLIYLYEIYASKQDFTLHLVSEHFKSFANKVAPMVLNKEVECFATIKTACDPIL